MHFISLGITEPGIFVQLMHLLAKQYSFQGGAFASCSFQQVYPTSLQVLENTSKIQKVLKYTRIVYHVQNLLVFSRTGLKSIDSSRKYQKVLALQLVLGILESTRKHYKVLAHELVEKFYKVLERSRKYQKVLESSSTLMLFLDIQNSGLRGICSRCSRKFQKALDSSSNMYCWMSRKLQKVLESSSTVQYSLARFRHFQISRFLN